MMAGSGLKPQLSACSVPKGISDFKILNDNSDLILSCSSKFEKTANDCLDEVTLSNSFFLLLLSGMCIMN